MIKTVTLTDGVNEIDISGGIEMSHIAYPFAHIRVLSGSDVLVSQSPDVAEGADGTAKTDSCVRIDLTGDKLYMSGSGAVAEIHTSVTAASPFAKLAKGGDDSKERLMIYNNGKDLNGFATSLYHYSSESKKTESSIYMYYYGTGVITTDKMSLSKYKRFGIALLSEAQGGYIPVITYGCITDDPGASGSGIDYGFDGNLLTDPVYFLNSTTSEGSAGGIYYVDIPDSATDGCLGILSVNAYLHVLSIWLE